MMIFKRDPFDFGPQLVDRLAEFQAATGNGFRFAVA
jgi:hypothetical protein